MVIIVAAGQLVCPFYPLFYEGFFKRGAKVGKKVIGDIRIYSIMSSIKQIMPSKRYIEDSLISIS
jgi:hypothetical protein